MPTTFRIIVSMRWADGSHSINDIYECELRPGSDARSSYYHWLHVARERAHDKLMDESYSDFEIGRPVGYRIMLSIVGKECLEYYCPSPPSAYVTQRRQALIDRLTRLLDRANNPR